MQPSSDLESFKILNEYSSYSMSRQLVAVPTHEIQEFHEQDGVHRPYGSNNHLNYAVIRQGLLSESQK